MAYTALTFVYGEVLTATKMNALAANDASFHDGSGLPSIGTSKLADNAVTTAKINNGAVTRAKLESSVLAFGNYSESEVDTGFTWIDGKHIYKKTLSFGNLPNSGSKNVEHNIANLGWVVDFGGIAYRNTDGTYFQIGNIPVPSIGVTAGINITIDSSVVTINTGTDRTNMYAYITIYYTKTS